MTEICLAKGLVNTLWLQLNPKKQKQAIEVFAEKEKKKQNHFWNTPFQRHRGGVFKGRNSYSTKDMRKRGKKYSTETTAQQLEEAWIPR